jgi:predicted O-linked N-acetylglucosamine transferase (SPINDLY family)
VYCYANVRNEDCVSEHIKQLDGINWYNIFDKSSSDVSHMITDHYIDILIDLAGHTNGNRLDVLALKPAPIQITYLGYPNTTGMKNIDYRITDQVADPIGSKQKYTEKLLYMPRCFICYTPNQVCPLIDRCRETTSTIVLGVLNKHNKYNQSTCQAWSDILKQLPGATLLIRKMNGLCLDGVESNRIKMIDYLPNEIDYYQLYNQIDISMDTFPYSGATTSCDSLLMSTPIVTHGLHDRHVSNVTNSILTHMGCAELVTHTMADYIKCVVDLARDPVRIDRYKHNMRQKFMAVMNGPKFASEFDQILSTCAKW